MTPTTCAQTFKTDPPPAAALDLCVALNGHGSACFGDLTHDGVALNAEYST